MCTTRRQSELMAKQFLLRVNSPVKIYSTLSARSQQNDLFREDGANLVFDRNAMGSNQSNCDSPLDLGNTVPFTPETSHNFSIFSLTPSNLPLCSTVLENTSEVSSPQFHLADNHENNMISDEYVTPKTKISDPVMASTALVTKRKGTDEDTGSELNMPDDNTVTVKRPKRQINFSSKLNLVISEPNKCQRVLGVCDRPPSAEIGQRLTKSRLPLSVKRLGSQSGSEDMTSETVSLRSLEATSPRTSGTTSPRTLENITRIPTHRKYSCEKKCEASRRMSASENKSSPCEMEQSVSSQESSACINNMLEGMADPFQVATSNAGSFGYPPKVLSNSDCSVEEGMQRSLATMEGLEKQSPKTDYQMENSAVTVAVRVRPWNERERTTGTKSAMCVLGHEIKIQHPHTNQQFSFPYDFVFCSSNAEDDAFASQDMVYRQLAKPLLGKAFEGYNICLFAYGQTGSGKSYTMMGYNEEIGIIPRFCKELFSVVNQPQLDEDHEVKYNIEMSYFEVYNERIHDLLISPKDRYLSKKALKVREHPTMGPYVAGLSTYVVGSFADVQTWLELGNKQRATAATGMNDKSSRSHSVFTLTMKQTKRENLDGEIHEHTVMSQVNLVDLAGSERCNSAQTSGIRLKEGASINKSLLTLGKVICALSETLQTKRKSFIPYRDSVLTWLLKESLGGNSKTAMIATISPAAMNIDETLSTLRYASQARRIINVVKVNEDPNAVLIRELKAEIGRLMAAQQCSQGIDVIKYEHSLQEIMWLKERLSAQENEMAEAERSWQDRLMLAEQRRIEEAKSLQKADVCFKVANRMPNLVNLNEDPQLSEMLLYIIKEGRTKVGKYHPDCDYEIQLTGALISDRHCILVNVQGEVTLMPILDAKTFVNGNLVLEPVTLHHGDRVIFGGNHYFRFNHPLEVQSGRRASAMLQVGPDGLRDFEFAKNELVEAQTQRIEAEINEAKLQAQQEMMAELQMAKDEAQQELSAQKELYENRIQQLEGKLEEEVKRKRNSMKLSEMDALRGPQALVPRILQNEVFEIKIKHCKFMEVLVQEKDKLDQEVEALQQKSCAFKDEESPGLSAEKNAQWSALSLSITLQEANTISRSLNRHTVFSRYDLPVENGETPTVYVRVTNTKLGIATLWSQEKFDDKLVSMRELYQGSYEGTGDDLFYDPKDTWESEVKLPSPKRRRSSLVRQTSGKLLGKVQMDVPVLSANCAAVCKRMVNLAMGVLEKEANSGGLLLQLMQDLQVIKDASADILQEYRQLDDQRGALAFEQVNTIPQCIKLTSAIDRTAVIIKLLQAYAPVPDSQGTSYKDCLVGEVKKLGANVAFLLHGHECEITSMIVESKEQVDQSVTAIASWLGQLLVAMGPEINPVMEEKCDLEQAELITSCLREAFLGGAETHIRTQIDLDMLDILALKKLYESVVLENKLAEHIRRMLLTTGDCLQKLLEVCQQSWKEFQSIKDQKTEKCQGICLQEYLFRYRNLSSELNNLLLGWRRVSSDVLQYFNDRGPDFQMLKQNIETFSKTAVLLSETLRSLYGAVTDEAQDPSMNQLALMTKDTEAAASLIHSSAKDLWQLVERLRGVNCPNSGMRTLKNKSQLPMGSGFDSSIRLWWRSEIRVRDVVAKLNDRALIKNSVTCERKTMV